MSQPADSPDSQPTPAEQPADAAHAGTPHYGTFGDPANVPATPEHHPNRQYVGGYMDPAGTHGGCETGPYEPASSAATPSKTRLPPPLRPPRAKTRTWSAPPTPPTTRATPGATYTT